MHPSFTKQDANATIAKLKEAGKVSITFTLFGRNMAVTVDLTKASAVEMTVILAQDLDATSFSGNFVETIVSDLFRGAQVGDNVTTSATVNMPDAGAMQLRALVPFVVLAFTVAALMLA